MFLMFLEMKCLQMYKKKGNSVQPLSTGSVCKLCTQFGQLIPFSVWPYGKHLQTSVFWSLWPLGSWVGYSRLETCPVATSVFSWLCAVVQLKGGSVASISRRYHKGLIDGALLGCLCFWHMLPSLQRTSDALLKCKVKVKVKDLCAKSLSWLDGELHGESWCFQTFSFSQSALCWFCSDLCFIKVQSIQVNLIKF